QEPVGVRTRSLRRARRMSESGGKRLKEAWHLCDPPALARRGAPRNNGRARTLTATEGRMLDDLGMATLWIRTTAAAMPGVGLPVLTACKGRRAASTSSRPRAAHAGQGEGQHAGRLDRVRSVPAGLVLAGIAPSLRPPLPPRPGERRARAHIEREA